MTLESCFLKLKIDELGWFPLRVNSVKIPCFSIQFYTRSVFAGKITSNRQTKNIYLGRQVTPVETSL